MKKQSTYISIGLKGFAMGMAEVVPGVSGGTIAFITGIYERLINCIKAIDASFFKMLLGLKFQAAFEKIDGLFLASLLCGMVFGIVIGTYTITHLLDNYPPIIWAFFFGLIIASTIYILRQLDGINIKRIILILIGAIIAFGIVQMVPTEGSTAYPFIFFSGMIAFCALILPGISGSFILLLMGMYTTIFPSLRSLIETQELKYFFILACFGLGGLAGLAMFSRILSYTFKNYKNETLAILSGFMIGSLWKIWPWRVPQTWMTKAGDRFDAATDIFPTNVENIKLLSESNVLPKQYNIGDPYVVMSILAAVLGFVILYLFDRSQKDS